jgi:capsule polysaccharide export protein KpsE/RkpR
MIVNIAFDVISGGIGFVVGAFTPAVGREIKSWFVKESTAVVAKAPVAVQDAVAAVKKV